MLPRSPYLSYRRTYIHTYRQTDIHTHTQTHVQNYIYTHCSQTAGTNFLPTALQFQDVVTEEDKHGQTLLRLQCGDAQIHDP